MRASSASLAWANRGPSSGRGRPRGAGGARPGRLRRGRRCGRTRAGSTDSGRDGHGRGPASSRARRAVVSPSKPGQQPCMSSTSSTRHGRTRRPRTGSATIWMQVTGIGLGHVVLIQLDGHDGDRLGRAAGARRGPRSTARHAPPGGGCARLVGLAACGAPERGQLGPQPVGAIHGRPVYRWSGFGCRGLPGYASVLAARPSGVGRRTRSLT